MPRSLKNKGKPVKIGQKGRKGGQKPVKNRESPVKDVRWCPVCRARQWHFGGVCEWAEDGHTMFRRVSLMAREK
jgi:hypothetical protein